MANQQKTASLVLLGILVAGGLNGSPSPKQITKGWRFPSIGQFSRAYCGNVKSPYMVRGDFNADGKADFAAIASNQKETRLIVVFDFKHRSDVLVVGEPVTPENHALMFGKGPATVTQAESLEALSIKVKGDFFVLVLCEAAAVAYCWNIEKKVFEEVHTQD